MSSTKPTSYKHRQPKRHIATITLLQPLPKDLPIFLKHFIIWSPNNYVLHQLCGLLGPLSRSEFHREKQESEKPSPHLYLFFLYPSFHLLFAHLSFSIPHHTPHLTLYYYIFSPVSILLLLLIFGEWIVYTFWDLTMSKKMKGVALYSSSYDQVDVAKARFKHQTLIQDYQELKREADAMKNKLETMKLRKLTLSAEVRFLQRRYQYLSVKPPPGHELVQKQNFQTQSKKTKEKNHSRKDAKLRKIAPITDVNKKEKISGAKEYAHRNPSPVLELSKNDRIHGGKETSFRYRTPAAFDLNQKERAYGGKQAALQNPTPTLDLNKREGLYNGKETTPRDPSRTFDLNRTERPYIGRKNCAQIRAPVFDLNQILGEEESHDIYKPLRVEKSTKKSIGGGADEQVNDLNSSVCRSLGNGPNRVGKRKISWQDQVALKV